MKKISLLALVTVCFSAIIFNLPVTSNAKLGRAPKPDQNDPELARTIRRMTQRSTKGLTEKQLSGGGGVEMDLQGRFQDIPLVKIDEDGDPAVMCVASIGEANRFFGRDLETGQIYSADPFEAEYLATKRASRSEMSREEYSFYKNLVDEAGDFQMSPNSASILIVNGDGPSEGFNDLTVVAPEGGNPGTTLGQQRKNLFNFAAGIWGSFLDSTVPISVNAKFDPLSPCSSSGGVLGSAGPASISRDFAGAEHAATWYPVALRNKIVGVDSNPAAAEINTTFNSSIDTGCLGSGTRFYYGLDNSTPSLRINLLVVLLHEMGHGLGFMTLVNGSTGALNGGYMDVFTISMYDRSTSKYWGDMTNAERQASALNDGNLMFAGINVRGASGALTAGRDTSTGHVQLFSPAVFQSGSSLSHFDRAAFPNLLMEPAINAGLPLDLDLTRQQMRDIGWYRDSDGDRVPDTITDILPGGSMLTAGSQTSVSWTNTGGFSRNVTIELSTDGGATFPTVIASNVPNVGSYAFTVPDVYTTKARIRVREHDFNSPLGISGSDVTIAPETSAIDISGQVLTPSGLGLRNATVSLIDEAGTRTTVATSSLGYYSFTGIPTGQNMMISVSSRRYRFESRALLTAANLGPVDFSGIE
ncbi:hypothetical protein BH20ACI2_BH20ACI2_11560 [soil metagenome]